MLNLPSVRVVRVASAGECLGQVADEIIGVFESDGDADGFFCDSRSGAGLRGHGSMAHGGWEGDEAFDAAEGFGHVEESGIHADAFGDGPAIANVEGQHGPESLLLLACQLVLGVGFQSWIVHAFDERVGFEKAGDAECGGLLGFHAAAERFDTAKDEPGVKG